MLLSVTHETHYTYHTPVDTAHHIAYLHPRTHPGQRLIQHTLNIHPTPQHIRHIVDVYGNTRCFFALDETHHALRVTSHAQLETTDHPQPVSKLSWGEQPARYRYRAQAAFDPATEFIFASPFVPLHPEWKDYANPSFPDGISALQGCADLMRRIHHDFTYESHSTHVNTPALSAFEQRKGVCQDFAHIMLGCLRSIGLPARYVSGYLLTQPPPGMPKLIGSDASHAWVSVYIADLPAGQRWCDFDPTNNRWGWHAPGSDYITLAIGRDFGDVSPLRGVIHGGQQHSLHVGVTVTELAALYTAS